MAAETGTMFLTMAWSGHLFFHKPNLGYALDMPPSTRLTSIFGVNSVCPGSYSPSVIQTAPTARLAVRSRVHSVP